MDLTSAPMAQKLSRSPLKETSSPVGMKLQPVDKRVEAPLELWYN